MRKVQKNPVCGHEDPLIRVRAQTPPKEAEQQKARRRDSERGSELEKQEREREREIEREGELEREIYREIEQSKFTKIKENKQSKRSRSMLHKLLGSIHRAAL